MNKLPKEVVESNSDLIRLAKEVTDKYGILPEDISIIQSGSIKTVWKIKTPDGIFCLKRLKQSLDKALFSVNAQIFIKNAGGKVPSIFASTGGPIAQYNGQLFVLYEWLVGKDLDFGNPSDLKSAIQGLAEFHTASKGYSSNDEARVSSKLGKWPIQYSSMKNKLEAWKETAKTNKAQAVHGIYLNHTDRMLEICDKSLSLLEKSAYTTLTAPDSPSIVLCHQDYGRGNALLTRNGVYILDLDGVTFDLPARDLRKLIGKQAENKGHWDIDTINSIVGWYTLVNPMTDDEKKVLYIDMMFPHWFYGLVKNLYLNSKPVKTSEIERISRLEQSKISLLEKML